MYQKSMHVHTWLITVHFTLLYPIISESSCIPFRYLHFTPSSSSHYTIESKLGTPLLARQEHTTFLAQLHPPISILRLSYSVIINPHVDSVRRIQYTFVFYISLSVNFLFSFSHRLPRQLSHPIILPTHSSSFPNALAHLHKIRTIPTSYA